MASYDEWNTAIAEYFVSASPSGATVYLSVDGDSLTYIGSTKFGATDQDDWVEDFQMAVRAKCVRDDEISLKEIDGIGSDDIPRGVAFLAAMVLAAHLMIEEEDESELIAETNYFTRLREVFGFSGKGRPPGLRTGIEEDIWETWNLWLIQRGWLPSADYGLDTANRYTNYPLSQALLRDGDRYRFERIFRAEESGHRLNRSWDRDRLSTWLRLRRNLFTSKHLKDLLDAIDPRRYEAFVDAVYEAFAAINWETLDAPANTKSKTHTMVQSRLEAGIYRSEDPIAGVIEFHVYPRRPKRWQPGADLHLIMGSDSFVLKQERQGWFSPLPEALHNLAGGVSYDIQGDPWISKLTVPERNFWILVRDPESPASGVFANWKRPDVGQNFLVLCRNEYADQLQLLREEDLLTWDHEAPLDGSYQGWTEYRECMVRNPNWDGVLPIREELYDELKPVLTASISFQGGLRISDQFGSGWLEGYQPRVMVTAFESRAARLRIANIETPNAIPTELVIKTNELIADFPTLAPGVYLLHTTDKSGGKPVSPRPLRILDWNLIDAVNVTEPWKIEYEKFSLRGAILEVKEADSRQSSNVED